jgi:glucosamine-6-phosphate deaminase
MNIIIVKNYEEMSRKAAHLFVAQLLNKPDSVLGLATGSTPVGMYKELIRFYNEGMITFKYATAFNLDEYVGIEKEHPQSYWKFMQDNLFNEVDLPNDRQFIPSGTARNLEDEAHNYDRGIAKAGGIDLQVLGIGRNGHIGFNEPDLKFEARTHVVKLDEQTIQDNSRFFSNISEVPTLALSMGVKTIMQSRNIILLASGKEKGDAIQKMLSGNITPELPASVLQLHPNVTAIIDLEAASKLDIEALRDQYKIVTPK